MSLPSIICVETGIKKGSSLAFKIDKEYEAIYVFLGDFFLYTYGGDIVNRDNILLYKHKHKIFENNEWKEECAKTSYKPLTLQDIYKRNKHYVSEKKLTISIDESNFTEHLKINNVEINENITKLIKKQIKNISK